MALKATQIDAFRAVMSTGSITNAALLLNKSQPSITRFIRELECELGFDLFDRSKGKVVPTGEAFTFLKAVDRSFAGLLELARVAEDIRNASAVRLPIATVPSATFELVPRVVSMLNATHPSLTVNTFVERSSIVAERVSLQQAQVGICNTSEEARGTRILEKVSIPLVAMVHPEDALASKDSLGIEDFNGTNFISLGISYFASQGLHADGLSTLQRNTVIEAPLSYTACSYVAQGLGVAISDPLTAIHFRSLGMKVIPVRPYIPYDIYIIASSFEDPAPLTLDFLEATKSELKRSMSEIGRSRLAMARG